MVVAVLGQVTEGSAPPRSPGDLDTAAGGQVLELGLQAFVGRLGELRGELLVTAHVRTGYPRSSVWTLDPGLETVAGAPGRCRLDSDRCARETIAGDEQMLVSATAR